MYFAKKRRHERLAVRAGRPVTQTTSSSGAIRRDHSITGISTRYYRFGFKQIQKFKFSRDAGRQIHCTVGSIKAPVWLSEIPNKIRSSGEVAMTNGVKSSSSELEAALRPLDGRRSAASGWLRVGAVAAVSAVLGGLA